jgi:hypothetical protein
VPGRDRHPQCPAAASYQRKRSTPGSLPTQLGLSPCFLEHQTDRGPIGLEQREDGIANRPRSFRLHSCFCLSGLRSAERQLASARGRLQQKQQTAPAWSGSFPDVRSTIAITMDDPRAPPEAAHPSSRSAPPALAPTTPSAPGENGTGQLPLRPSGHELPFVAPSSYLRPKPVSRTMSERTPSALDKEQMQGLVSMPIPRQPSVMAPLRPVRGCWVFHPATAGAAMRGSAGLLAEPFPADLSIKQHSGVFASSSKSGPATMCSRSPSVSSCSTTTFSLRRV